MIRPAGFVLLAVATSGCALLLDFDLTGGHKALSIDAAPGSETGSADASVLVVDRAEAGAPSSTLPSAPFECPTNPALCDNFERDVVLGGRFLRDNVAGASIAIDPSAGSRALEIEATIATTDAWVGAEQLGYPDADTTINRAIVVGLMLRLDYDATAFTGARTILAVTPHGTVDSAATRERAAIVVDAGRVRAFVVLGNGASTASTDLPEFTTGTWHRVDLDVRFHPTNGHFAITVDGGMRHTVADNRNTLFMTTENTWSLALAASASATASPIAASFDDVTATAR